MFRRNAMGKNIITSSLRIEDLVDHNSIQATPVAALVTLLHRKATKEQYPAFGLFETLLKK